MYDLLDFIAEFYGWLFLKKKKREFSGDEARKAYLFSYIFLFFIVIIIIFLAVSLFISPSPPQKT